MVECRFNPHEAGKKAQGKFEGRCMWCSPVRLATVCKDSRQQKLAASFLAILHDLDKDVFDVAVQRVSTHEGGEEVAKRANAILADRAGSLEQPPALAAAPPEEQPPDDEGGPDVPPPPAPAQ